MYIVTFAYDNYEVHIFDTGTTTKYSFLYAFSTNELNVWAEPLGKDRVLLAKDWSGKHKYGLAFARAFINELQGKVSDAVLQDLDGLLGDWHRFSKEGNR